MLHFTRSGTKTDRRITINPNLILHVQPLVNGGTCIALASAHPSEPSITVEEGYEHVLDLLCIHWGDTTIVRIERDD
jgi:hypothetical protein